MSVCEDCSQGAQKTHRGGIAVDDLVQRRWMSMSRLSHWWLLQVMDGVDLKIHRPAVWCSFWAGAGWSAPASQDPYPSHVGRDNPLSATWKPAVICPTPRSPHPRSAWPHGGSKVVAPSNTILLLQIASQKKGVGSTSCPHGVFKVEETCFGVLTYHCCQACCPKNLALSHRLCALLAKCQH